MEHLSASTINQTEATLTDIMPRLEGLPNEHAIIFSHQSDERIAALPSRLSLVENEEYRKGREDSMHDVWFADAVISSDSGTSLSQLPVAIKPYKEMFQILAGRDYETSAELNRIGGAERRITFSHVGFMREHGGTLNTLTVFEEGVTSCDNLLFNPERTSDDVYIALTLSAESLLFLHGEAGMTHGDFLPRNSAYGSDLRPRIIDVTTVKKSDNPDEYVDDLTRFMLGAQDERVHEDLRVPNEAIAEFLLDKYRAGAKETLPSSVRKEVLGKVGCLLSSLG